MNKILPLIIVLIAVGGSGFAAMTLRGGGQETAAASGDHGDKNGDKKGGEVHKVEDKDGSSIDSLGYYKFQRDFIVPIMRRNHVDAIVLISFNIEMEQEEMEKVRPKEPKFRDAFMKTLLGLSHDGLFNEDITAPAVFETLQTSLADTAKEVIGESAHGVVIVDFARQDR